MITKRIKEVFDRFAIGIEGYTDEDTVMLDVYDRELRMRVGLGEYEPRNLAAQFLEDLQNYQDHYMEMEDPEAHMEEINDLFESIRFCRKVAAALEEAEKLDKEEKEKKRNGKIFGRA